jgi:tRNA A-37 threonylcarbamoyl transferase component Bud32
MTLSVPSDFVWVRRGRRLVLVRKTLERPLGRMLLSSEHAPPEGGIPLPGGRGGSYRLSLDSGDDVVVRLCRRGGVLRWFVRDLYWQGTREPRPFVELATTEEARRRGVPAPEPLGARIDRLWSRWYRGVLVTRHLPGAAPLWRALEAGGGAGGKHEALRAAGRAIRTLWDGGVYHPDMNLNNCLVRAAGGSAEVFVVDFDGAYTVEGAVDETLRARMLARLERSARKLDPSGAVVSGEDLRMLVQGARGDA